MNETTETVEESTKTDPLAVLVGDHPKTRMLIALRDATPHGLNPTSLADNAAISRQTVHNHLGDLEATGMVVEDERASEQAGNSTIYKLDTSDERTEWLAKLQDMTGKELRDNGYYSEDENTEESDT